jgi:hypothetical protein
VDIFYILAIRLFKLTDVYFRCISILDKQKKFIINFILSTGIELSCLSIWLLRAAGDANQLHFVIKRKQDEILQYFNGIIHVDIDFRAFE